jgi:hypothetical protein
MQFFIRIKILIAQVMNDKEIELKLAVVCTIVNEQKIQSKA